MNVLSQGLFRVQKFIINKEQSNVPLNRKFGSFRSAFAHKNEQSNMNYAYFALNDT